MKVVFEGSDERLTVQRSNGSYVVIGNAVGRISSGGGFALDAARELRSQLDVARQIGSAAEAARANAVIEIASLHTGMAALRETIAWYERELSAGEVAELNRRLANQASTIKAYQKQLADIGSIAKQ